MVNTNMLDPNGLVAVNRKNIATMGASKVSMMPTGLLDVLHEDEILDLMAYLFSRGDPNNKMFAAEAREEIQKSWRAEGHKPSES